MKTSLHGFYILGSLAAAIIATAGIATESPFFYGILPALIGGLMAGIATVRFMRHKEDLAGFVATACGFAFYQAFQGNPVTLPEFSASLTQIALPDQLLGIFVGNFTTGLLLLACRGVGLLLERPILALVPHPAAADRLNVDHLVLAGFAVVFAVVALPNVLFGDIVVGAIKNIIYQRASWDDPTQFSGFNLWGGPLGASAVNMVFWATSLFVLWLYLLGSRFRWIMWVLAPLVLLWTASVALQGSRTYLVTIGLGLFVYVLGNRRARGRIYFYAVLGAPVLLVLLQIAAYYRTQGLGAVDVRELGQHLLEIRGNEGTSSQMDGFEFFRTEYLAKNAAPNPVTGFARGLLERPLEGLLMPVPRSLFPWKPFDDSGREFSLFYQDVRLGVHTADPFIGASPGLMGREVIRYGVLGPVTVLFWLGLVLALADRLFSAGRGGDFHRIFAAVLVSFFVAEMRDWVPLWFLPFMPAIFILGWIARRARLRSAKLVAARRLQERRFLAAVEAGPVSP